MLWDSHPVTASHTYAFICFRDPIPNSARPVRLDAQTKIASPRTFYRQLMQTHDAHLRSPEPVRECSEVNHTTLNSLSTSFSHAGHADKEQRLDAGNVANNLIQKPELSPLPSSAPARCAKDCTRTDARPALLGGPVHLAPLSSPRMASSSRRSRINSSSTVSARGTASTRILLPACCTVTSEAPGAQPPPTLKAGASCCSAEGASSTLSFRKTLSPSSSEHSPSADSPGTHAHLAPACSALGFGRGEMRAAQADSASESHGCGAGAARWRATRPSRYGSTGTCRGQGSSMRWLGVCWPQLFRWAGCARASWCAASAHNTLAPPATTFGGHVSA